MPPQETPGNGEAPEPKTTPPQTGSAPEGENNQQASGESQKEVKEGDLSALPEWARKKIGALNAEAREHRLEKEQALNDKKSQEEAALKDKEEWKTLAQKYEKELLELRPRAQEVTELTDLFKEQINTEIADWPEEVKSMAPKGEVSVKDMLAWRDTARPLVEKLKGSEAEALGNGRSKAAGNSSGPKPKTQGTQGNERKSSIQEPVVDALRKF